ncbi:hypothetical protein EV193_104136 [Herbihabitans rhizosphaerae]|uniref:NAD(P)-binding domain-containing protein n=1 Tax=Herbihabitans rhizosphaerae TaxID=1872711 RepID=A0A4Q7KQW1_9PSEU|nr:NAD(P)H-binding protein [Herbihabitans rhizosphaerae]RZS38925.1 hypothetical protein EV193_104136 [Herbihabitans rhizosphaerae]
MDIGVLGATVRLDVVVNAGGSIEDQIANAGVLPAAARTLLTALERRPATRLIVVGGGGSLEVAPGDRLIDDDQRLDTVLTDNLGVPLDYRKVVLAEVEVLELCRLSNRYWTYVGPAAGLIHSGERTGRYRTGGDQLLAVDADISAEDLAVAIVDEIEIPRHIQRRFAVGA